MANRASSSHLEQVEECRQQALAYAGKPEAAFLLRVAEEVEQFTDEQLNRWTSTGRRI